MSIPYITAYELNRAMQEITDRINAGAPAYKSINKIDDYAYDVEYEFLDYTFANETFLQGAVELPKMGCSSVRSGNFYGRKFDWFYNNDCDFVVRTTGNGKIPSVGVAGSLGDLNKNSVEKGTVNPKYWKILPFCTLDGLNDAGVFINSNVIPQDLGKVIRTQPTENLEKTMFTLMWPRFVLDNFTSAEAALEYAQKHISFFSTKSSSAFGYDLHFMIGDANKTYVAEFINNKLEYKEADIMTNFHIIPVTFNADGTVYTPATQDDTHNAMDTNNVSKHGSGLERYNIAVADKASANSKAGMLALMGKLNYNNAYEKSGNDSWYTEFVGQASIDYTVKTPASVYEEKVMPIVKAEYAERDRNKNPQNIWHTTHTSIYDLQNKKLYLYTSSEDNVEHVFNLKKYYTSEEIDALLNSH